MTSVVNFFARTFSFSPKMTKIKRISAKNTLYLYYIISVVPKSDLPFAHFCIFCTKKDPTGSGLRM